MGTIKLSGFFFLKVYIHMYIYFKFICFLLHWVFIAFSSYRQQGTTRCAGAVVCGLLIVVASLVAEHGLWACRLRSCGTQA